MNNLNKLEVYVLNRLSEKYPIVKKHIPCIMVSSREVTGVGMYVNFRYCKALDISEVIDMPNISISTNEIVKIHNLEFGLGYEVNILDGKLNFIEFVTYGERWDGLTD